MKTIISLTLAILLGLSLAQSAALAQDGAQERTPAAAYKDSAQDSAQASAPASNDPAKSVAKPDSKTSRSESKQDASNPENSAATPGELTPQATANQKPTPDVTGTGGYTVNSSAEFGYRFTGVDGSLDKFKSDLNYQDGMRLLSSDFLARAPAGAGTLFDNFLFHSFGWGGDPSQFVRAQIDKDRWYRFDATYRRISYFNNLSSFDTLSRQLHSADTTFALGDFDLTLLPQNEKLRINLGYSFDRNDGTSLTTYHYQRNDFQLVSPVRDGANNFRLGADSKLWIFDISFMQGLRYFKNDMTYTIPAAEGGLNPGATRLATLQRDMPTRGTNPFTRLSVHTLLRKMVDITGRFIYSSATTDFTFQETATGTNASGDKIILDQTNVTGTARRPNTIGDVGVSIFATDRLTISDTLRYNSFKITGENSLLEALAQSHNNAPLPVVFTDTLNFTLLEYRVLLNTIEADYKFHQRFTAHVGYRHTDRRVVLAAYTIPPGGTLASPPRTNATDSVFGGFRAKPTNIWSVYFDFEHGQADNVFIRTANYNYDNFRVRTLIKPTRNLAINASLVTRNNDNPTLGLVGTTQVPFGVTVSSRFFSGSIDWTVTPKVSLSSGYTYMHMDSNAAVVFFLNNVQTQGTSLYFMRDTFFFANARLQPHPRVTLYAGFRVNRDLGQGDRTPSSPSELISSYPYHFLTPDARLTVNLCKWLDWNAGYQRFDYNDKFFPTQNYLASVGYLSLTVRFNRE
jgi:hypothetical protein